MVLIGIREADLRSSWDEWWGLNPAKQTLCAKVTNLGPFPIFYYFLAIRL